MKTSTQSNGVYHRQRFQIRLAFSIVALFLTGCGSSEISGIVGRWIIAQPENLAQKVSGNSLVPKFESKMSVQFEKSGVLRTETKIASIASTKQGTWKLIGYDSVTAIMQVECTLATQTTVHEIEFEDADTIRWIPPNLAGTTQNLKFVREK